MRTNIVLDDQLLAEAMKYSTSRSKRGVVHEALAAYVTAKAEQQRVDSYRDRLDRIRRTLAASGPKRHVSSSDLVRADRERDA